MKELARELFAVALAAVAPAPATRRALGQLGLDGDQLATMGVLAMGKAAPGMLAGLCALGRPAWALGVAPAATTVHGFSLRAGGHPLPDARSLAAGEAMLACARDTTNPVVCLVSGGASALVEALQPGVTLARLRAETEAHMHAGAPIEALNAHRIARSRLKGGGLRQALGAREVFTVVISDVFGPPWLVGSGPTLTGPDPGAVVAADNATAVHAMARLARERGHTVAVMPTPLRGEAREAGPRFIAWARAQHADVALAGGETTVTVTGSGRGGRNGELALSCLADLAGETLLFAGTDGVDGSSDAAGACIDEAAQARLHTEGLSTERALADNDSHPLLERLDALVHTGPTGTNVADVAIWISPRLAGHRPGR